MTNSIGVLPYEPSLTRQADPHQSSVCGHTDARDPEAALGALRFHSWRTRYPIFHQLLVPGGRRGRAPRR